MKIVADPNIPFVREAFEFIGKVKLVPGRAMDAATVRDADLLLVRSVTPVNRALIEGSRVKFVATATIGTDHIDKAYLASRGITFASAAGSNANSVAEYVVAAMLEIAHRKDYRLRDKTLGVVGVGNVGSRVVKYAEALGMRVLQNDPPRQRAEKLPHFVSLEQICAEADIITLHVPLTTEGEDATYHLIDGLKLAALKRQPMLINTARGAVVDNQALWHALYHRRLKIANVVLDVWENEPNISLDLLNLADLATPHIAGYSFDGKVAGTWMVYRAACQFLKYDLYWEPTLPPAPPQTITFADDEDDEDVLRRAIKGIYDICADDAALRSNPGAFDRLRANYPERREFHSTELRIEKQRESLLRKLSLLGFRVS